VQHSSLGDGEQPTWLAEWIIVTGPLPPGDPAICEEPTWLAEWIIMTEPLTRLEDAEGSASPGKPEAAI